MTRRNSGTPWVTRLILINVIVYLVQIALEGEQALLTYYFGLTPSLVAENGYVWQIGTYMFLHDRANFWHIFLNMYALLIFGMSVEQVWGGRRFLFYYFFTGIGAGLTIFILNMFLRGPAYSVPTIGASGAVFGLLLAFGVLFPDAQILLFFILPIRARYLVVLYGAIEMAALLDSPGGGSVSHVGHLGGLLFGILYFTVIRRKLSALKIRKLQTEIRRKVETLEKNKMGEIDEGRAFLEKVLLTLEKGGEDTLSDDDFQRLQYLRIMKGEEARSLCVEEDFSTDDAYCKKCADYDACLLRKIDRLLQRNRQ